MGLGTVSQPHTLLAQAVHFALDHEIAWSREITDTWGVHQQDPPPWNRLLGPMHARGPVSGTMRLEGKTLISWGEPDRADLTFSVAKTYLALLAGVACERGSKRSRSSGGTRRRSCACEKAWTPCAPVSVTPWWPPLSRSRRRCYSESSSALWWRITTSPLRMSCRAGRFDCNRNIMPPLGVASWGPFFRKMQ
jgi:hypothetical protein